MNLIKCYKFNNRLLLAFLIFILSSAFSLFYSAGPCLAQVELKEIKSQVNILQDGKLKVKYNLRFLERQTRNLIKTVGPFDANHSIDSVELANAASGEKIGVSLIAPAASIANSDRKSVV